jgi:hypothetical protein
MLKSLLPSMYPWLVRVLVLTVDGNQSSKGQRSFIGEKKKERLHVVMQWDLETSGLLSQIGSRIL